MDYLGRLWDLHHLAFRGLLMILSGLNFHIPAAFV